MRAFAPSLVLALLLASACDSLPTEASADLTPAPTAVSGGPLKAIRVYTLSDGTVVRTYNEAFTETGQPCNEIVTIRGFTNFTTSYREADGGFTLKVLVASIGSGWGHTSQAKYYKYYVNAQTEVGRVDGSPEREFTLIQSYRIFRLGEDADDDDAYGRTYYHIKVNSLGEILDLTQESFSDCA